MSDKRERFLAAARRDDVDRPPVGAWIHYGSAWLTPEATAAAHLAFQREFDWDYIKVMHDYRFPTGGLQQVTDPAQLDQVGLAGAAYPNYDAQRRVLDILRAEEPDVPLVETVFAPVQSLVRALGAAVVPLFQADPDLAHRTLDRVASRLEEYVAGLADQGVDGLFCAVTGLGTDWTGLGITPEQFRDWVAPYDRRVFAAADGLVRIVHPHGENLDVSLIEDYPAEVMSWSDVVSKPTIEEVAAGPRVPMLGLNELGSSYWTPDQVVADVIRARRAARDRLIVAPNCTVHTDMNPTALHALRRAVELPV